MIENCQSQMQNQKSLVIGWFLVEPPRDQFVSEIQRMTIVFLIILNRDWNSVIRLDQKVNANDWQ